MKFTEILRLKKPEFGDEMNVEDLNDNADMIDETFNKKSNEWIAETSGTSTAYTVTLDPAPKQMYVGMRLTIIPHVTCSSKSVTLSVNGFDAKPIRQRGIKTDTALTPNDSKFMTKDRPVTLIYDGRYWIMTEYCQPSWEDVIGTPETMKNPYALTLSLNGNTSSYTGETSVSKAWYAPTSFGTEGYDLIGNGNTAPVWRAPHYAVCTTSGSTKAKTASITNFKLFVGVRVLIKFIDRHSTWDNNPTLNISGTGAKPILYGGGVVSGSGGTSGKEGVYSTWNRDEIVEFIYDGTYWRALSTEHRKSRSRIVIATSKLYGLTDVQRYEADYVCDGTNDDEILDKALNDVAYGGTIFLMKGKYYIKSKHTVYGCIIEGYKERGYSAWGTYVTALNFAENGCIEFSGMDDWLVLKNVVISASVTDEINPILTAGDYGYTPFRMDGVTIEISFAPVSATINPLIKCKNIEMRDCIINYSLWAKTSGEFTEGIYPLIQCKSINIDRSTIQIYNRETNANVKPQFVVNAESGNVHNCKITTESGMYPAPQGGVNFFCCGISVQDCNIDLLLKNHTLCSDLTSALRGKNCVFCNNVVEHCYNALNYGVISGNIFRRKSLAPPEEKIDVYCDAVITGNRFDKPSFDFHGHKILFSNNMLDNPLVNTEFPSGSINENNLISS